MQRFFAISTVAALTASASHAQDLPQAGSDWFTDADAVLQQMLERQPITGTAKNVILLVADGNGVGTNYVTRLFAGQQEGGMGDDHVLPYETFPNLALVKTYNINAQTPDSAPTAGAMNTGVKQRFNLINLNENAITGDCSTVEGNELTTFAEIVSEAGKSVGVVSTARLTHATPAGVYAKTAHRNWEDSVPEDCTAQKDIATQLVDQMEAGVVDFAMGGGRRHFVPEGTATDEGGEGVRADGTDLIARASNDLGVQYVWNLEGAKGLNLDGSTPVLGLFEDSHMQYEAGRDPEGEPSLADMTRMAIEYLQNNEDGYYLEIEAGRVDHANHANNAARVVTDGLAFAEAVAMADELTNDEDTLIIVTADHEHSIALNGYCGRGTPILGLCMDIDNEGIEHNGEPVLADDGKPYTVVGYLNGSSSVLVEQEDGSYAGSRPDLTQDEATDVDYVQQALIPKSSESHSGEDVAIYAKGPWAHLFDGTIEQNYIFHVMNHAVQAE
ncbi:alkaline phosphatase [Qingshengfaniella alkalisoli]|uniref:Alkaline phosphatase n=1 Tax=Qingshengfaniella alkalisoli TaxID=2599296 RepID=A0A5B8JC69_9RHOB|nr:alkaline phosphatase [Qingshengfaniella alkalisoli]QDY71700.1 alkaline phosphatase [Qingshengfaniella alkalisoli]